MSPAFLATVGRIFEKANVTVDWFHVVQLFTKALRWAVLKAADGKLTTKPPAGGSPALSATPVNASAGQAILDPVRKALETFENHLHRTSFSAGPRPTPTPASKG